MCVKSVKSQSDSSDALNFGMLFQGAALLQWLSVYDNVALPMRQRTKMTEEQIRERVEERLEWVGLTEAASQLPAQLSGGMQKRVGLARATIMNRSLFSMMSLHPVWIRSPLERWMS